MTDKSYLEKMCAFMRELNRLNPLDQDDAWQRDNIMCSVRMLNQEWNHSRQWRHWHYVLQLIILFLVLAFVIVTVVC